MKSQSFFTGLFWVALSGVCPCLPVVQASSLQYPLSMKTGEVFMVDNFDFKVTRNDVGFNFNSGNMGDINDPKASLGQNSIVTGACNTNSCGSVGGSWAFPFDFTGYPASSFCGCFLSLSGLTDTLIELQGTGIQPSSTTIFTNHFLNFNNLYGEFLPWPDRSIDKVAFDTCLMAGSAALTLKVELKDANGWDVFTRVRITTTGWATASLSRALFSRSTLNDTVPFRWDKVRAMAVLVERNHDADNIHNPTSGGFLVDNIRLIDTDGLYPNLPAARDPATGGLATPYRDAFLDYLRKLSFLYFLDSASSVPSAGGIIHDRGTFADLLSVGGVGFQLTAYVIGAERGYLSRSNAAARVEKILQILQSQPQGTNRVGTAGYKGFYYHFLGIDGLRKQNFDFTATTNVNEALNTVELSPIDTALALMGVITVKQYFAGSDPIEAEIRVLAKAIIRRVEWPFILSTLSDGKKQACLGWKPVELRDDTQARFLLPDGTGAGFFSSKIGANGVETAATLDYYTDEALIIAMLAMAAPDTTNRLPREVWDDIIRQGSGFVKTYPGALFTYEFLSCWLNTRAMGPDNHVSRPMDLYENTVRAIAATRDYAITNTGSSASGNSNAWFYSACEGAYDDYGAEGAPTAALADYALIVNMAGSLKLEGEDATGDGSWNWRGSASGLKTRYVTQAGAQMSWIFSVTSNTLFDAVLRYSNDGPSDTLAVTVDGRELGRIVTGSTGSGGAGWNIFKEVPVTNGLMFAAGIHTTRVTVVSCDSYGVEVDVVRLDAKGTPRPLSDGTLAPYSAGASIVHMPDAAVAALWYAASLDLNGDGIPDLLHPRYGFADAFNAEISNVQSVPGRTDILRHSGAWANMTGFSIDQGPMLIMVDNYLGGQFVPQLFMSDPDVHRVLTGVFDAAPDIYSWDSGTGPLCWRGAKHAVVELCDNLVTPQWKQVGGIVSNNMLNIDIPLPGKGFFRVRQVE